ncbi:MAG: YkgJ family cysteine cluster protein [Pirellulaceae bacterium]|nr:YkgJ family cysteine cluster protein [Pirellulaceae bacterium]
MTTPWYADGLAFQCTQCGNCCSGPNSGYVWVDEAEIQSLATAMEMADDTDGFERRFVRQVGIRKSLVEYSDGDCIFLDPKSRKCSVYDARPIQCRTWPFWDRNLKSQAAWASAAEGCPGCNRGNVYPLQAIENARLKKTV